MKNIKLLSFFCFITLVGMECPKEPLFDGVNCEGNCYVITGKVIDSALKVGLPEAKVVFNLEYNIIPGWRESRILAKTTTNDNGEYKITFDGSKLNKDGSYYYEITHPEFTTNPVAEYDYNSFNLNNLMYGVPYVINIPMFKEGTLKFHVKSDKINSFDHFNIRYSFKNNGYVVYLSGKKVIDTIVAIKTAGGIKTHFTWLTTKNDINSPVKSDSIFVPQKGEATYNLIIN